MIEFLFFVVTAMVATLMVLFSLQRGTRAWIYRGIVLALFALFLPTIFFSYNMLPGLPRKINAPSLMQYHGKVEVIGFYTIKNKGIYLLLDVAPGSPSIYYALPWSESKEQKLQQAASKATRQGSPLMANIDKLRAGADDGDDDDGDSDQQGRARKNGMPSITGSGDRDWDDRDPIFYPEPQPATAPKQPEPPPVTMYQPNTAQSPQTIIPGAPPPPMAPAEPHPELGPSVDPM